MKATLTMSVLTLIARSAIPAIFLLHINLAQAQTPSMIFSGSKLPINADECIGITARALEDVGLGNFLQQGVTIEANDGGDFSVLAFCTPIGYGQTLSTVIISSLNRDKANSIQDDLTRRINNIWAGWRR